MKNPRLIFFLSLITLLVSDCKNNDANLNDETVNDWIRSTIDSTLVQNNNPAFVIAINRLGQPTQFASFGTLNEVPAVRVDETAIFPIGLISKAFTGIIVNSLIEEGALQDDEPTSTYLSDLLTERAVQSFNNIRLRNLLHHRSGITDNDCTFYKNNDNDASLKTGYTADQLVNDLNLVSIDSEDHSFEYSNFGYVILGFICEKVSGKSYASLLKEYVTDKYDLSNTTVTLTDEQKSRFLSLPVLVDDEQGQPISLNPEIMAAADGIYSNVEDLSKLQTPQFGIYRDYIQRGDLDPMVLTDRTVRTRIDNWEYGSGFMEITNENSRYYGYYRNDHGYASIYLFSAYPYVGITVLTSRGGPWLGELGLTIMDGLTDNKTIGNPKARSLAWTLFSVIDTEGLSYGLDWFYKNKGLKKYKLVESEVNTVGYRLLREQNVKESIAVFKLNVSEFPESSNVYDSLGEAYAKDENTELAIFNYQKSLDLDPDNSRAVRMLEKLRSNE